MSRNKDESAVISRLIGDWINNYLPSMKARSVKTIEAYENAISLYLTFLETEKIVSELKIIPDSFCYKNIERWLIWIRDVRNCCPATCNNRLAAIRAFLKYVAREIPKLAYLYQESMLIPQRKTYRKHIMGMTKKAMAAVLSIPNQDSRTGRRDLTLFSLMYDTAVRIDEILSLHIKDLHLDIERPSLTVIGKGSKLRTISLMPKTIQLLRRYIKDFHGLNPSPGSIVFYSRNTGPSGKMSQSGVNKQLKGYALIAHESCPEVPQTLHAHQIRHASASHWIDDGLNIVQISHLLGHSDINTTMVYLDISEEMKARALAKIADYSITTIPKEWKQDKSLASRCGIKPIMGGK
jgi:site-specific recombinase XerD